MPQANERHILVIDDEAFVRELLSDFLEKLNCIVVTAPDATTGIEAFANGHFDAVLVDLKMPGKSGIDALREIRQLQAATPVIIMTGYPTVDSSIEALRLGAYDYIIKPFKLQELRDVMERAIKEQELQGEMEALRHRIADVEQELRDYRAGDSRSSPGDRLAETK